MKNKILILLVILTISGCDGLPWHCHTEVACDINDQNSQK